MSSLLQRLEQAMKIGRVDRQALISASGVSPAAASKWFRGTTSLLKADHAFRIARVCKVNAEWLATGRGQPVPLESKDWSGEFEAKHVDLLRMYKRLPDEVRSPIRQMIETLAAAQREGYVTWANQKEPKNV